LMPFSIRFHLHPDVRPSLSHDNSQVLLMLPDGDGWTFRSNWPGLALEESIYLGSGPEVRRTSQIVVSGIANKSERTSIRWALHRVTPETTRSGATRRM
jgi:uncharacterized heparinase superfamily protein